MSPLWSGLIGLIFTPNNLISVLKHNCSSETHWFLALGLRTTKALASPKSANFKRISLSIRRFWGLNFDGLTREIRMLQNRWVFSPEGFRAKGSRTWCLYEWCAWPQRCSLFLIVSDRWKTEWCLFYLPNCQETQVLLTSFVNMCQDIWIYTYIVCIYIYTSITYMC